MRSIVLGLLLSTTVYSAFAVQGQQPVLTQPERVQISEANEAQPQVFRSHEAQPQVFRSHEAQPQVFRSSSPQQTVQQQRVVKVERSKKVEQSKLVKVQPKQRVIKTERSKKTIQVQVKPQPRVVRLSPEVRARLIARERARERAIARDRARERARARAHARARMMERQAMQEEVYYYGDDIRSEEVYVVPAPRYYRAQPAARVRIEPHLMVNPGMILEPNLSFQINI